MMATHQFTAYLVDTEGGDIQTLSFPGITNIKGVRIVTSSCVTNGTPVVHGRIGIGYWDGSNHRAMSIQSSDNDSTPNCGTRHDTATIVYFINTTTTAIVAEAEVSSVGDGFVKIHWSDYPGTALLMSVTVYYGADVQCNLHDFTGHGTAGNSLSKSGLSFAPNWLEVLCIGTTFAADSSFTNSAFGVGTACEQADGSTILQGCHSSCGRNLPTTNTACGQVLRDDAVAQKLTVAAGGTVTAGATWVITDFTGDGYTVQTGTDSEALTNPVFAVRFPIGERWVAIPSLVNSTTGVKSIATSPNFKPRHVRSIAAGLTAKNTVTSNSEVEFFGLGGAMAASDGIVQSGASYRNDDGILPSVTRANADLKLCLGSGWSALLDAFTTTGFDVNVDDAATSDFPTLFTAVGYPVNEGWLRAATRRFRRQLQRM